MEVAVDAGGEHAREGDSDAGLVVRLARWVGDVGIARIETGLHGGSVDGGVVVVKNVPAAEDFVGLVSRGGDVGVVRVGAGRW